MLTGNVQASSTRSEQPVVLKMVRAASLVQTGASARAADARMADAEVPPDKVARDAAEVEAWLEAVLDRVAPRTNKEKQYLRKRCRFVDVHGARCTNQGQYESKGNYLCIQHGGKIKCFENGCEAWVEGKGFFCAKHAGRCMAEGCKAKKALSTGYCTRHRLEAYEKEYEEVRRLKRIAALRARWLDRLLTKQGGRCAQTVKTCEEVDGGEATSVCPLGRRHVHRDAAQVEHIVPLGDGGDDLSDNLQVLCAYCHAIKSAREARARATGSRKRKADDDACRPCAAA